MRFLKNNHTNPYYNMAFDEYCLEKLSIEEPVFYLWQNRPSVIVGANQEVKTEVNLDYLKENGIDLVRRVTGGGAVYHDFGNLNYTIVGNSENLEKDYPEYAGWMAQALQSLGVPATLSGRNDIMVEGRKVSGFAKRVCKTRLMVHGTLMYDVDIETLTKALNPSSIKLQSKGIASVRSRVANLKEYLSDCQDIHSFKNRLEQILSRNYEDQEYILSNQDLESIRQLAEEKFAQKNWIYGHAPKATYHNSAHWPCGNIQVHMDIASGKITSCRLDGDFIGNLPVSDLEALLIGSPYDRSSIMDCLQNIDIADYFDGVTNQHFVQLILE